MFRKYFLCFALVFPHTPWTARVDGVSILLGNGRNNLPDIVRGRILDSNGLPLDEYVGQEGYLKYVENYYPSGNMGKAFDDVTAAWDNPTFIFPNWQYFPGTLAEFKKTKRILVNESGNIRPEYRGENGYIKFSRVIFTAEGKDPEQTPDSGINMERAFSMASAVLDYSTFMSLNWRYFEGTLAEFKKTKRILVNESGNIRPEYRGENGYIKFSRVIFTAEGKDPEQTPDSGINMERAFSMASAVLDYSTFMSLNWRYFEGTLAEFKKTKRILVDKNGNIRPEYRGENGYIRFSRVFFTAEGKDPEQTPDWEIRMEMTYWMASAVLDRHTFKKLRWRPFPGNLALFNRAKGILLDEHGNIRPGYEGQDGYIKFSRVALAAEGKDPEQTPDWEINMDRAFEMASAVLDNSTFMSLNWQYFLGTPAEFKKTRRILVDESGNILPGYEGRDGYIRFARVFYTAEGQDPEQIPASVINMWTAFEMASAVLDRPTFKKLRWRVFPDNLDKFNKVKGILFDEYGNIRSGYKDQDGYIKFARLVFTAEEQDPKETPASEINLERAFEMASGVMDRPTFRSLRWQRFPGDLDEFYETKERILKEILKNG